MALLQNQARKELAKRELATRTALNALKPPEIKPDTDGEHLALKAETNAQLVELISTLEKTKAVNEKQVKASSLALDNINKTLKAQTNEIKASSKNGDRVNEQSIKSLIDTVEKLSSAVIKANQGVALAISGISERIERINLIQGADVIRDKQGNISGIKYIRS